MARPKRRKTKRKTVFVFIFFRRVRVQLCIQQCINSGGGWELKNVEVLVLVKGGGVGGKKAKCPPFGISNIDIYRTSLGIPVPKTKAHEIIFPKRRKRKKQYL